MAYQHHSETIYTLRALETMADASIPSKVKTLYALLLRLSRNGREAVFASAGWLAAAIGRAVSVYYEHRAILAELGLIGIDEQRVSYDRSAPSRIRVRCVRDLSRLFQSLFWRRQLEAWKRRRSEALALARAKREARKTGSPENRRQKGTIQNGSSILSALRRSEGDARRQAARAAFLERTGMSQAELDLIPDAVESTERSRC